MATITGTAGNDSILTSGVSSGVTGGVPSSTSDTIIGTAGNDTIDGGATAANFLDYAAFTAALTLAFTSFGAGTMVKAGLGTDTFSNIQRFFAGSGADTLTASNATGTTSTWLRGNAGNDTISGASSRAVAADYGNSAAAINVDLAAGTAADGWGSTDTLTNVRRVNLSAFNDTLVGSSFGDIVFINVLNGAKTLNGGGASDRGNEIRYSLNSATLIDLGTVSSGSGGYIGSATKSNGVVDSLTNFTRALGGTGADTILGSLANDVLMGEAGNDLIMGRSGYNTVQYTDWNISAPIQGVIADLGLGTVTDGWGGTDTLVEIQGIFGSAFADDLKGRGDLGFFTRSNLEGAAGNDILRGAATGFSNADYANSAAAVVVNLLTGTASDGYGTTDTLTGINSARGSAFDDMITGGNGDDWLSGGNGNDILGGGTGNDRLLGDDGNDTLSGGGGNDAITGGNGQDSLTGGTGADRFAFGLTATPGAASSGTTSDIISDFSTVEGDMIRLGATGVSVTEIFYAGSTGGAQSSLASVVALPAFSLPAGLTAMLAWYIPHTSLGGWLVVDEDRDGTLQPGEFAVRLNSNFNVAQLLVGGSGVASLVGDTGNNSLFGTGRPEGLRGLDGDDVLYGSGLLDSFAGGLGNDQFVIRNFESAVLELVGEGYDTAWVGVSGAVLSANIEEIRLFDTANLVSGSSTAEAIVANAGVNSTLYGNGGDDTLWGTTRSELLDGGDGDDIIRSQGGVDTLVGGVGNDQYVVFNNVTRITEHLNGGYDTVYVATSSYTVDINIEVARLSAVGAVYLSGSLSSEALVANQGEASTLDGNAGDDTLYGSGFADTLNGGSGDDIMRGQGGADVMNGGAGNDQYVMFSSAGSITDGPFGGYDILYFAGSGTFSWVAELEEARLVDQGTGLTYGGAMTTNKLLVGNNAGLASTIFAGNGNDIVYGTAAADTLAGGFGNDTIYSQGGADRIYTEVASWGIDQVAGFSTAAGAKLQFAAASGVTSFGQLSLNSAGGNTQVSLGGNAILLFGVASLTASDFIFG